MLRWRPEGVCHVRGPFASQWWALSRERTAHFWRPAGAFRLRHRL